MSELLFGVTLAFVGYVLYQVFRTVADDKGAGTAQPTAIPPVKAATSVPAPVAQPAPVAAKPEPKPEPVPAAAKTPAPAPVAAADAAEPAERGALLRNPATGEISPVPTNYRFAKKWIKEALVAEGLLDHVYKPNELDDAAAAKVKNAIDQFRLLDKYQA